MAAANTCAWAVALVLLLAFFQPNSAARSVTSAITEEAVQDSPSHISQAASMRRTLLKNGGSSAPSSSASVDQDDDDVGDDDSVDDDDASTATCSNLYTNQGWKSGTSKSPNVCCADTWKNQKPTKKSLYSSAKSTCENIGARLCTQAELNVGAAATVKDDYVVWTSTACVYKGKAGQITAKTKYGKNAKCETDLAKFKNAGIVCCADA